MAKKRTSSTTTPVDNQALDNHANQLNPQHPAFYLARGYTEKHAEAAAAMARAESATPSKPDTTKTR